MKDLLSQYSITEIILIAFLIVLAVKEIISLIDFFKNKTKKTYDTAEERENNIKKILEKLESLDAKVDDLAKKTEEQEERLKLLTESDKDQLKSFIVKEYHFFCDTKGWIDDFSIDTIEKCYSHYKDEGGNSYVADLMTELRKLPHKPN